MRAQILFVGAIAAVGLGFARPARADVTAPLVKQGHHTPHYVPVCIHESTKSNGYIGNCIKPTDDMTVDDVKRAILEAIQIRNRYGLADVELYYSGSCGSLDWPAADPAPPDGKKAPGSDVVDSDTINEIGCSVDADLAGYSGYTWLDTTDVDDDDTRNGNTIDEFSIWLNASTNWTRDLTTTGNGTLMDRTVTHELGHALGLRHNTGPGGNGCNDASLMCTSTDANIFFLYSDAKVLVEDSVDDDGEDAEGWNNDHWMQARRQADDGAEWEDRSGAWGEFSDFSLLAPAIASDPTTSNYMVGWSRPADEGCFRTAIGDGTSESWEASTYHGFACSFHSFALAAGGGKWLAAWREPGSDTDTNRDIGTRYYDGKSWSSPVYLNINVDAWAAPAVAYHPQSNRFIVGWVHSGVGDGLGSNRFARFRTADASSKLTTWTPAVQVWADDDGDGVVDTGEKMTPWDSFDIDCGSSGPECEVAYVEANGRRQLRSFRIAVAGDGSVSYIPGSRQDADGSSYRYQGGTAYAINTSTDERRAIGLRAATGYNKYNYPVFKQPIKTGALGTWGFDEFFSTRNSADRAGFTHSAINDEWMMVYLAGELQPLAR